MTNGINTAYLEDNNTKEAVHTIGKHIFVFVYKVDVDVIEIKINRTVQYCTDDSLFSVCYRTAF